MGAPCDTGRTKCELLRDFPQMVRWKGIDDMAEVRAGLGAGRGTAWGGCGGVDGEEEAATPWGSHGRLATRVRATHATTGPPVAQVWWSTDFFEWDLMR